MKSLAIAILLFSSTVHAGEIRPYVRWLPVAYYNGIDNKPSFVGTALPPTQACDNEVIKRIKREHRIPDGVTVGCKPWTPKFDDNL